MTTPTVSRVADAVRTTVSGPAHCPGDEGDGYEREGADNVFRVNHNVPPAQEVTR